MTKSQTPTALGAIDHETERAAKALEFAEYLAKGAEQLLAALEVEDEAHMTLNEFDRDDDEFVSADREHCEAISARCELASGLRSDVYEFRKRAALAPAAPAPEPEKPFDVESMRRVACVISPFSGAVALLECCDEIDRMRAAKVVPEPRCPNCDDTGDVHSIDGEWRGICSCKAGNELRNRRAPAPARASVPPGWKLVPDSATHNMLNAANAGRKKGRSSSGAIYSAMLAAAPPHASVDQAEPNFSGACAMCGALVVDQAVASSGERPAAADGGSAWIAVSERLPDDRVSVLAWDGERIGLATNYAGQWGSITLMYDDVTHWMPIPPPPALASPSPQLAASAGNQE